MKVYLVGGAVRDELLGRPIKDRDYVVCGSTPEEMLSLGYKQVGCDFPVFLHPDSGEEYALARTERKTGKGYQGFVTDFDPSITLEDDLRRRDLTINAMAKDLETGEIIDPFNGCADLENKILRHVSPAFAEDPLRVLRVARFRARYNFKIAAETHTLMLHLVQSGELNALTPERVWVEMEKGLSETNPPAFIWALMGCEAWEKLFPNVRVGGTFHYFHNMTGNFTFDQKLMVLFSETSEPQMDIILEKYKASAETIRQLDIFKDVQEASQYIHSIGDILNLLKKIDAFRRPEYLQELRVPSVLFTTRLSQFVETLIGAYDLIKDVSFTSLTPEQQQQLKGADIGKAIDFERLRRLV